MRILALDLATKTGGAMWDGNRVVSERLGYDMLCRMKPKSKPSKGEFVASFEELLKLDAKQDVEKQLDNSRARACPS